MGNCFKLQKTENITEQSITVQTIEQPIGVQAINQLVNVQQSIDIQINNK